jgi:DNA repair protein RadD
VISNVALLAEGWDFPACGVMVLARPTKSLIRWIQMVGRVLRPYPGKERAIVLDHSGSAAHLGYPTEDLPLKLDDGAPKKPGTGREMEPSKPKKCPSCSFLKHPKVHVCPACGFAPERQADIEVKDGKLVRLERVATKAGRDEKQSVYSGLLWIAQERGRRSGWAAHTYRDRFGVWPRGLADRPEQPSDELARWVRSRDIRYAKRQRRRPCGPFVRLHKAAGRGYLPPWVSRRKP